MRLLQFLSEVVVDRFSGLWKGGMLIAAIRLPLVRLGGDGFQNPCFSDLTFPVGYHFFMAWPQGVGPSRKETWLAGPAALNDRLKGLY
jgi:hypothetical protein